MKIVVKENNFVFIFSEIPLPVHFEALLKSGEWQNKPPPKPAKTTANDRRYTFFLFYLQNICYLQPA